MRHKGALAGTAALLAASALALGAARSCRLDTQEKGFDAYLPLGEDKIGLSCTGITDPSICTAGSLGGKYVELDLSGHYMLGSLKLPVGEGKQAGLTVDIGKRSVRIEADR